MYVINPRLVLGGGTHVCRYVCMYSRVRVYRSVVRQRKAQEEEKKTWRVKPDHTKIYKTANHQKKKKKR